MNECLYQYTILLILIYLSFALIKKKTMKIISQDWKTYKKYFKMRIHIHKRILYKLIRLHKEQNRIFRIYSCIVVQKIAIKFYKHQITSMIRQSQQGKEQKRRIAQIELFRDPSQMDVNRRRKNTYAQSFERKAAPFDMFCSLSPDGDSIIITLNSKAQPRPIFATIAAPLSRSLLLKVESIPNLYKLLQKQPLTFTNTGTLEIELPEIKPPDTTHLIGRAQGFGGSSSCCIIGSNFLFTTASCIFEKQTKSCSAQIDIRMPGGKASKEFMYFYPQEYQNCDQENSNLFNYAIVYIKTNTIVEKYPNLIMDYQIVEGDVFAIASKTIGSEDFIVKDRMFVFSYELKNVEPGEPLWLYQGTRWFIIGIYQGKNRGVMIYSQMQNQIYSWILKTLHSQIAFTHISLRMQSASNFDALRAEPTHIKIQEALNPLIFESNMQRVKVSDLIKRRYYLDEKGISLLSPKEIQKAAVALLCTRNLSNITQTQKINLFIKGMQIIAREFGPENELLSTCYFELANLYEQINANDKALRCYELSFKQLSKNKWNPIIAANCAANITRYYGVKQENEQIIKWGKAAIEWNQKIGYNAEVGRTSFLLMNIYTKMNRQAESVVFIRKGLKSLIENRQYDAAEVISSQLLQLAHSIETSIDQTIEDLQLIFEGAKKSQNSQLKMIIQNVWLEQFNRLKQGKSHSRKTYELFTKITLKYVSHKADMLNALRDHLQANNREKINQRK